MHDVIAIGDVTTDIYLGLAEAELYCEKDTKFCRMLLAYGKKIPVNSLRRVLSAGNAANHATGIAKLGGRSALLSVVGTDSLSLDSVRVLKSRGVSTTLIKKVSSMQPNYSTILDFVGERTILVYHDAGQYELPSRFPKAAYLFFTSMAAKNHDNFVKKLLKHCQSSGQKLVFSPGTHQLRLGQKKLLPILQAAEWLFVNKEEGESLLGSSATLGLNEIIAGLRGLGVRNVVVTDADRGATMFSERFGVWHMPVFRTKVVERTGAGDAFASGFVFGLSTGVSHLEALRYGAANAAGALGAVGPHDGLLTAGSLSNFLKKHASIRPFEQII